MNQVEDRLRQQLQRQADQVVVLDGWEGIQRRIERRGRGRQVRRTALTVVMVSLLCAGAVAVAGRAGQNRVVTNPATPPPPAPLPRLVLGLDGLELRSATDFDPSVKAKGKASAVVELPPMKPVEPGVKAADPTVVPKAPPGDVQLSLLTTAGGRLDGPLLFVRTVANAPQPPRPNPAGTSVAIGDQTAVLQQLNNASRSLSWQAASGPSVHLTSMVLNAEELVAAGRALVVDAHGGITWTGGAPPAGLVLQRTSTVSYDSPRPEAEVDYTWQGDRMTLRLQAGDVGVLDDLVADRVAGSGAVEQIPVGGATAAWINTDGGGVSVIWPVRPGVVAELVAEGSARQKAAAALQSVRELSADEWNALVKRAAATAKGTAKAIDPAAGRREELCRMRAKWLGSGQAKDPAGQATVTDMVKALVEKATAAGWGKDGDIGALAQRLLDAMARGDTAAVAAVEVCR